LTILELLVTSGILSLLAALLLPSVMSARESARRLQCTNHLRQIGLALHGYHDLHNCLPAGWQAQRCCHCWSSRRSTSG
jgi:type II secretory pathway pseudopilin PulG